MYMQKIIVKTFLATLFIFCACEQNTIHDRDSLVIHTEFFTSWVRNFEPLNPASIPRWPTSGGIYEPLYI